MSKLAKSVAVGGVGHVNGLAVDGDGKCVGAQLGRDGR